jgi:hypothetical protein
MNESAHYILEAICFGALMQTTFPETLVLRGPPGLRNAIRSAARREHTTTSDFLRRAALAKLREAGVPLSIAEADTR